MSISQVSPEHIVNTISVWGYYPKHNLSRNETLITCLNMLSLSPIIASVVGIARVAFALYHLKHEREMPRETSFSLIFRGVLEITGYYTVRLILDNLVTGFRCLGLIDQTKESSDIIANALCEKTSLLRERRTSTSSAPPFVEGKNSSRNRLEEKKR